MTLNSSNGGSKFDDRIDEILSSEDARARALASSNPALRAAAVLTAVQQPRLSAQSRARILSRVQAVSPQAARRSMSYSLLMLAGRAAAVLVVIFLLGLVAVPTLANSVPGDAGYEIKRDLETVELTLSMTPTARATTHLRHADRRIDESETLVTRGRFENWLLDEGLASINSALAIALEHHLFAQSDRLRQHTLQAFDAFQQHVEGIRLASMITESDYERLVETAQALAHETDFVQLTFDVTVPVPLSTMTPDAPAGTTPSAAAIPVQLADLTEEVLPTANATPDSTEPLAEMPQIVYVSANRRVNIRSGPGTENSVVASAQPGEALSVLQTNGQWLEVVLPSGTRGWISASLATTEPPGQAAGSGGRDFGCDQPGNACNAPGQQNGNANGRSNGRP